MVLQREKDKIEREDIKFPPWLAQQLIDQFSHQNEGERSQKAGTAEDTHSKIER
jgi:hypothetical protein